MENMLWGNLNRNFEGRQAQALEPYYCPYGAVAAINGSITDPRKYLN